MFNKNKIKLKDCELELVNMVRFLQSDMAQRKNFKDYTVEEVMYEFTRYNQIGIEDGWLSPTPYWMKKLFT